MDFRLTPEQQMLQDSARDFLADHCSSDFVRQMEQDRLGFTPELWGGMAELGWMGLLIPEEYGGIGWGLTELVVMAEEMGRACLPGPFLSTTLGALALARSGSEAQKQEILPKVVSGEAVLTLAYLEAGCAVYDPLFQAATARKQDGAWLLEGGKLFVPDAEASHWILLCARTSGSPRDQEGISLFLAPRSARGLELRPLKTIAGDKQFEVSLKDVALPPDALVGEAGQGWPLLEQLLMTGALAKCGEMVGGAAKVLEITADYAKERVQFGSPIGRFQAVQHHCANMLMDLESSRFITRKAAWSMGQERPNPMLVAAAKAWVSEAYRRVVSLGHQIGAATAYIVEHDMTLFSRRAKAAELAFGDAAYHYGQVAQRLGL